MFVVNNYAIFSKCKCSNVVVIFNADITNIGRNVANILEKYRQ